jgi:hypothetical protein
MTDTKRQQIVNKAIFHLFDSLSKATEDFFKPLGSKSMTAAEYGEIQVTAAANYLRYCIHNNIVEDGREKALDLIIEGMRQKPSNLNDQSPKMFSDQKKVDLNITISEPQSRFIVPEDNKVSLQ